MKRTGEKKPSIEKSVKDQFAKVFSSGDWKLFKDVAEINLVEAATLKKSSFKTVKQSQQLLIRNIRKRLLIGIGAELLLKSIYLKSDYGINKPLSRDAGSKLKLPFKLAEVAQDQLDPNDTFTLSQLIEQLSKVLHLPDTDILLDGLRIAKVFRNKEGHVVTKSHVFVPSNYRAIETALIEVYARAFDEKLTVHFSIADGEKDAWRVET
jgi:hypothetical protein